MMAGEVKAGGLLAVTITGACEGGVTGVFVALRDFDTAAELADFLAERAGQRVDPHFDGDEFLATLEVKGLLMGAEYSEMFLPSCGDYRDCSFVPPGGIELPS